jgi:hypothetical protein
MSFDSDSEEIINSPYFTTEKIINSPYFTTEYIDNYHELNKIIEYFKEHSTITQTNMEEFDRKDLLNIGRKYMETKGYNNFTTTTESNSLVEHWIYNVSGKKLPTLSIHCDDDGGVTGCVDTLILYYKFDEGIENGNLKIFFDTPISINLTTPTKIKYVTKQIIIDPRPTEDGICVLCIRGDVLH